MSNNRLDNQLSNTRLNKKNKETNKKKIIDTFIILSVESYYINIFGSFN